METPPSSNLDPKKGPEAVRISNVRLGSRRGSSKKIDPELAAAIENLRGSNVCSSCGNDPMTLGGAK